MFIISQHPFLCRGSLQRAEWSSCHGDKAWLSHEAAGSILGNTLWKMDRERRKRGSFSSYFINRVKLNTVGMCATIADLPTGNVWISTELVHISHLATGNAPGNSRLMEDRLNINSVNLPHVFFVEGCEVDTIHHHMRSRSFLLRGNGVARCVAHSWRLTARFDIGKEQLHLLIL